MDGLMKGISTYVLFSILQDLQRLVDILRLTHELLSEHVKMDPYPLMMGEMTETISLVSFSGRVATQVVNLACFLIRLEIPKQEMFVFIFQFYIHSFTSRKAAH